MRLEVGKSYRARTSNGEQIRFTVTSGGEEDWPVVDVDSPDGPEPGVSLNLMCLLWISTELQRTTAVSKATEEVIEALERSTEEPG